MLFSSDSRGQQGQQEQRADKMGGGVYKAKGATVIISSVSVLQKDLVISKLKKIIKVIFQGRKCVKKTIQSCCQRFV